MKRLAILLLLTAPIPASAKDDWQSDFRTWSASSQTNPLCKVRYATGIYRPGIGDGPQWGFMTEKMFKWFSKEGVKNAPSVCPAALGNANYRILLSESPVTTVSQTTHGAETRTSTQPFNASITSRTTYPDGSTSNSTGTVYGEQTSTVVVPTETTISRSSSALYMYTYRVSGTRLELISTDRAVFNRVKASGSGDNAAGAALGAGIGNLIRASGDKGRVDKLYEEALNAIRADSQGGTVAPVSAMQAAIRPTSPSVAAGSASDDFSRVATYRQECSNGDMQGCANLGLMYRMGWGVPKDAAQATEYIKKACDGGVTRYCTGDKPSRSESSPKTDAVPSLTTQASVSIDSTPAGADIEIDGAFVGNTPSTISVASGSHQVSLKKKGFTDWSRPLSITGGTVHVTAELEQKAEKQ